MTARFPTVDVIGCGQSQAIMGFTGGGETNDAGFAATGGQRLAERLGQLQAGVTFNILGSSGVGTMEADTVLFEEFRAGAASQGFYQGSPFAPLPKGTTQLAYINSRAAANKLGVVVIYQHAQDVNAGGAWSDASYAAFSAALVDRMISDAIAAGWGDYAILAVLSSTRGNGTNEALTAYRRTWDALAGHDQWQGLTRRTRVLRPVYLAHKLDIDRWSNTSSDRTHMVASTARRIMDIAAVRIAGLNGAAVPVADQPRLYRAVRLNATTVRAFIALGQRGATFRHNPVNTATARFVLLGGGTITAAAAPDNSGSANGFATIDLTVSGLTADSRLAYAVNFAAAEFENGDTPPRGALRNTAWAIAAGTTLANPVTDEAQDAKLPAGQFALGMANNDRGVALEAA
jgi:hypothetical protein